MEADPINHPEELWGIEDPRIVWIAELGKWAITYTAYSRGGPLVAMALTDDFVNFDRLGPVMPPEDKDAALFRAGSTGNGCLSIVRLPLTMFRVRIFGCHIPTICCIGVTVGC